MVEQFRQGTLLIKSTTNQTNKQTKKGKFIHRIFKKQFNLSLALHYQGVYMCHYELLIQLIHKVKFCLDVFL